MNSSLAEAWKRFRGVLELYGQRDAIFNPPCSPQQLQAVEDQLHFRLPASLATLLGLNNGQAAGLTGERVGVFKSISGWNVYTRHIYLSIPEIASAYQAFIQDEILLAEFGADEIPFAVCGSVQGYREAFCINRASAGVSLFWTEHADPFNPPEWQVARYARGDTLEAFLEKQIELYR